MFECVEYLFVQVIPQAICSRYGLAVGANMVWLVDILMVLCWPIAYPIGGVSFYLILVNWPGLVSEICEQDLVLVMFKRFRIW